MNAVAGDGSILDPMTAKERLLHEGASWTEDQARQALAAATGRIVDDRGDLGELTDATTGRVLDDLAAEERAAGFEPWRP
jgi:hypothetical protein